MINKLTTLPLLLGASLALSSCSNNKSDGAHHIYATVNAGEIGEACPELQAGQTLVYHLNASKSVEFNLHYHTEDETSYPIEPQSLMSIEKEYQAPIEQTYCLMWKGLKDKTSVEVTYRIKS